MKVAVTGGAGYIGSTLVKKLIDGGSSVASVDNLVSGSYGPLQSVLNKEKMNLHVGDIRNEGRLMEIFRGSEAIAHLAAIPGLVKCRNNPEEAISVNVYGTHQVLEVARKLDIGKVVFCSTAAVYGKPVEMPVRESHPLKPLNLHDGYLADTNTHEITPYDQEKAKEHLHAWLPTQRTAQAWQAVTTGKPIPP